MEGVAVNERIVLTLHMARVSQNSYPGVAGLVWSGTDMFFKAH